MASELRLQRGDGQRRRVLKSADIDVMEKNWGWSGWNTPDAGNAIQEYQGTPFGQFDGIRTLGGAKPNNDGRYVSGPDPFRTTWVR